MGLVRGKMTRREHKKLIRELIKKAWPIILKYGLKAGTIWLEGELEKINKK